MPIVVTGCQGQLGSELCRQLGPDAVGLDLPEFDLCDAQGMRRALVAVRPRAVVNTAAYTLVDRAEQQPDLCQAINADAVGHLADLCRELDAVLVHLSTDYVFGHGAGRQTPYAETDEPHPQGVYARSKLVGERLAAAWPRHFLVRSCGLYGRPAPRSAGHFVATMLRLARQGRPLRVGNDQCCSPTYVPHLARAIRFLLGTTAYGTYHVVNTGQTTWYGFAAEIFRQAGLSVRVEPITTAQYGAPAPRPAYSALDTAKYHALPGRPAMPSWQTALGEYLREAGRWDDGTA